MTVYKVNKSAGLVQVQKAPQTAGPWTTVDPAAALAVHTYGTGALGFGADNDASKQTALVILLDHLGVGAEALALTPSFTTIWVARWGLGSFITSPALDKFTGGTFSASMWMLLYPDVYTATDSSANQGVPLDLGAGKPFVVQQQNEGFPQTGTLNGKLQEGDADTGPWTDVANGAFTEIDGTADDFQTLSLFSSKRWISYVATIAGVSPHFHLGITAAFPP